LLDDLAAGKVPTAGPQNGRFAAEPLSGLSSLTEFESGRAQYNASAQLAKDIGDTVKRIDGTEVPLLTPWLGQAKAKPAMSKPAAKPASKPAAAAPKPVAPADAGQKPAAMAAPRAGQADDLKLIKGIGPKLEKLCHGLGFYHFDQIAQWSAAEIAWVDDNLEGFKGRVTRDDWVGQARRMVEEGKTQTTNRVKKGAPE